MSGASDPDQERRARIDLLLLDIEHRIEQISATRGQVQQLVADAALKRQDHGMSNRRFLVSMLGAAAALIASGAGLFAAGAAIWRQPTPVIIQLPPRP